MKKQLLLAVVLLAAFGIANADAPKGKGLYLGGSAGNVVLDDDGSSAGTLLDDSDSVVGVYLGYKFFQYMAIEARYSNLGSYTASILTLDISAVSLNAVGMIPFGSSGWELFGQVGLAEIGIDNNVQGLGDLEDNAVTAGIGVRWHITQNIALGAQVDAYAWSNDTIGSDFDLGVATQQVFFQINF